MWEISNYNQIISFLLSLCLGGAFCLLYDIVRALRKVCLNSFFAITITDMLLWGIYAIITFLFLIVTTKGEIRAYVLVGEFFGFILVRITISKIVYKLLGFVIVKISTIIRKLEEFFELIYTKFEKFILKMLKCSFEFIKSVKKLLKNMAKLLYTNKNISSSETNLNETKTKA